MKSYLDSNCLSFVKNWIPMPAQVGLTAGRLADEIQLDFEILKIFNWLNYLDFYFGYSSAMLLTVLKVHFIYLCINICIYSRTSINRITIIRTLGYPNAILNFKIPKMPWFSAKPSNKWSACMIFRLVRLIIS